MHRGQRTISRSQFSLSIMDPGAQTQIFRLRGKGLDPLGHFTGPKIQILIIPCFLLEIIKLFFLKHNGIR